MKTSYTRGSRWIRLNGATIGLWIVQGLLAALFLFAGVMKLVLPIEAMSGPIPLPGAFLRFLGVAEVLGAIGLIAPGALGVLRGLTPVAAGALAIVMIGATEITVLGGSVAGAAVPFIVGLLLISVVYGRRHWLPAQASTRGLDRSDGSVLDHGVGRTV